MDAAAAKGPARPGGKHPEIADIRDLVAFRVAMLAAANDRVGQSWMKAEHGVSLREWRVLGIIAALEPVKFGDVVHELQLDKGQLSRLVKALVDRRFVQNRVDTGDQRVSRLSLTPAGRDLHGVLLAKALRGNDRILAALSAAETETFIRLLDKLQPHMVQRADVEAGDTTAAKRKPSKTGV
ncbi:MarR family winged helix-turn-helix transcriptional regulator [Amorphus sp. MBR-141]